MKLKYGLIFNANPSQGHGEEIGLELQPLVGGNTVKCMISKKSPGAWPVQFATHTADMQDFIADVTELYGDKCSVEGVYRKMMRQMRNIRVCSPEIKKKKDRVMVTEHVNIEGKFDYIATKQRVLHDVGFVNIGWSDENGCEYIVIDTYTGESKLATCPPVAPDEKFMEMLRIK
jgi:hypothetical protein